MKQTVFGHFIVRSIDWLNEMSTSYWAARAESFNAAGIVACNGKGMLTIVSSIDWLIEWNVH